MKTKTKTLSFEKAIAKPRPEHLNPQKPNPLLSAIIRIIAIPDLMATGFTYTTERMEETKGKPCLILMNHSSFIDLEIASKIFYPKPYGIVCTSDGFVGKNRLMRMIGCFPTQKFVSDFKLIEDIKYLLNEKNTSVLMYPEASYSFDGTATALPRKMGVLLKKLNVPVVTVITQGAFARQPLYNMLKKRKVKVSAHVKCLFTAQEIKEMSTKELDEILDKEFSFDNFRWQEEQKIEINETFRADGLHRILYKCPHCLKEDKMIGKGIMLTCNSCGAKWEMTSYGQLKNQNKEPTFDHIPNWYAWQRQCVKAELENNEYHIETDVDIGMMVDYKAIYMVGNGKLKHNCNGFELTGCEGKLNYTQPPLASYGLYADYYWYEIGDVICIGNKDALYYCFPKDNTPVAKTRMAAEELYKLTRENRKKQKKSNQTLTTHQ